MNPENKVNREENRQPKTDTPQPRTAIPRKPTTNNPLKNQNQKKTSYKKELVVFEKNSSFT